MSTDLTKMVEEWMRWQTGNQSLLYNLLKAMAAEIEKLEEAPIITEGAGYENQERAMAIEIEEKEKEIEKLKYEKS